MTNARRLITGRARDAVARKNLQVRNGALFSKNQNKNKIKINKIASNESIIEIYRQTTGSTKELFMLISFRNSGQWYLQYATTLSCFSRNTRRLFCQTQTLQRIAEYNDGNSFLELLLLLIYLQIHFMSRVSISRRCWTWSSPDRWRRRCRFRRDRSRSPVWRICSSSRRPSLLTAQIE